MSSAPYPAIPEGAETALCLFGAAFKGYNDGQHLIKAGLRITVVDIDHERLRQMEGAYPNETYVCADAYRFASDALRRGAKYDVVSVDPFSDQAYRALAWSETWAKLADKMLTLGCSYVTLGLAGGCGIWRGSILKRNPDWCWLVRHSNVDYNP